MVRAIARGGTGPDVEEQLLPHKAAAGARLIKECDFGRVEVEDPVAHVAERRAALPDELLPPELRVVHL